jgi:oligopeptide/dipeptide ABC transporter ATP-binding protein
LLFSGLSLPCSDALHSLLSVKLAHGNLGRHLLNPSLNPSAAIGRAGDPASTPGGAILEIDNLQTHFFTADGVVRAVDGVSYAVRSGETLGVVGESGCGKSVTALSVLRLIATPPGRIVAGAIRFEGRNLLAMTETEMEGIRGNDISMIFQEPMTSLNPLFTVGRQISEAIALHQGLSRRAAMSKAVEMLQRVNMPEPEQRAHAYPHQLSGGMRQRVCIAMALLCDPEVLIADEPTTMLDVTIQSQILELLRELRQQRGMSILFITHDLGVVAELCDRVVVMYAGRIVEQGPTSELLNAPLHPYTEALLRSTPRVEVKGGGELFPIAGLPPRLSGAKLTECAFAPRCTRVREGCREGEPALVTTPEGRLRRCIIPVAEMSRRS